MLLHKMQQAVQKAVDIFNRSSAHVLCAKTAEKHLRQLVQQFPMSLVAPIINELRQFTKNALF